jgi:hypothetical protein
MATPSSNGPKKKEPLWLVYISAILTGILLIADSTHAGFLLPLTRLPAKLGIALIFSALALLIGGDKRSGIAAAIIIWAGVLMTLFT